MHCLIGGSRLGQLRLQVSHSIRIRRVRRPRLGQVKTHSLALGVDFPLLGQQFGCIVVAQACLAGGQRVEEGSGPTPFSREESFAILILLVE